MKSVWSGFAVVVLGAVLSAYQAPQFSNTVRRFIKHAEPEIVLTNARVIDGIGRAPSENLTIVIRDGLIAEMAGGGAKVNATPGATSIDLAGKTVLPGLVMFHEHLYYPTGGSVYAQLGVSFSRLYLAGGVTTMRTGARHRRAPPRVAGDGAVAADPAGQRQGPDGSNRRQVCRRDARHPLHADVRVRQLALVRRDLRRDEDSRDGCV